ncbi:non-hydrolyzing UDP-N-acetylglucosamine 2-epimerase [Pseudoduganella plicata]|uniref:UDP-N-acetylglucosamine 2-epimerase (Non-hydrolyzing) n=1 Tax=Pseudoduganella plicata TaxID=321984 RepID=A0A4P7BGD5_9BURK|nr:UDP-N-acetylglucosamine 2-epimerase (non-hydrolyzing) [Pseudoduganella plicata]QBQ37340.1 UDP-N-acetylglucosamine 2-epimerase (non-hydrolyzing) [Pseudoduganella plicata]GGZ09057.1 UDP-N-acetylglucosamine 2-epimerase (non-hydrolyzing) [Pseudoduganella plicata]
MSQQNDKPHRILCVVGARPNFMKMAPIMAALSSHGPALAPLLVHTGQHYDVAMNHQYFQALGIPDPDINLEVGSGSHAQQTAEVMRRFEPALDEVAPAAVLVVGDVNSTIACALVAAKKGVPVIHVEAGLRSFDRAMPEEINRVLTDQLSSLLFTTEESGRANLLREGIDERCIHFVGNVMIDTLRLNLPRAIPAARIAADAGRAGFTDNGYAVLTLHRPSNVDDAAVLQRLLETAARIGQRTPVFFPVHPRTHATIERFGLSHLLDRPGILLLPPMGYLEMLGLMKQARVVLTDSGGIQEETTALGTPCITLRHNTERPITVDEGTNTIAGSDPAIILAAYDAIMAGGGKAGRVPHYWDGRAAERIAVIVRDWLRGRE